MPPSVTPSAPNTNKPTDHSVFDSERPTSPNGPTGPNNPHEASPETNFPVGFDQEWANLEEELKTAFPDTEPPSLEGEHEDHETHGRNRRLDPRQAQAKKAPPKPAPVPVSTFVAESSAETENPSTGEATLEKQVKKELDTRNRFKELISRSWNKKFLGQPENTEESAASNATHNDSAEAQEQHAAKKEKSQARQRADRQLAESAENADVLVVKHDGLFEAKDEGGQKKYVLARPAANKAPKGAEKGQKEVAKAPMVSSKSQPGSPDAPKKVAVAESKPENQAEVSSQETPANQKQSLPEQVKRAKDLVTAWLGQALCTANAKLTQERDNKLEKTKKLGWALAGSGEKQLPEGAATCYMVSMSRGFADVLKKGSQLAGLEFFGSYRLKTGEDGQFVIDTEVATAGKSSLPEPGTPAYYRDRSKLNAMTRLHKNDDFVPDLSLKKSHRDWEPPSKRAQDGNMAIADYQTYADEERLS